MNWFLAIGVLTIPFGIRYLRNELSVFWLQLVNLIVFCSLAGGGHGYTEKDVLATGLFAIYGVAYSVLGLRRKRAFERALGVIGLLFVGGIAYLYRYARSSGTVQQSLRRVSVRSILTPVRWGHAGEVGSNLLISISDIEQVEIEDE